MGLLADLGYEVHPANRVQRVIQRVAGTKPMAWALQRTLFPIDRLVYRWSGGRVTAAGIVAGIPVVLLTTTGRKSGEPRTMPLLGVPVGEHLAIVGSNYGQAHTPGWVYNLEADPAAEIAYRDRSASVVARLADDAETDRVFELASAIYPGYREYRQRATGRTIRVFLLEPAP